MGGCSTSGRTTAFSESTIAITTVVFKKETARRVRKKTSFINTTTRRIIQAQSVDNIREKAKKDSREGVPKHENNFNAKYVPFASSDKSEIVVRRTGRQNVVAVRLRRLVHRVFTEEQNFLGA